MPIKDSRQASTLHVSRDFVTSQCIVVLFHTSLTEYALLDVSRKQGRFLCEIMFENTHVLLVNNRPHYFTGYVKLTPANTLEATLHFAAKRVQVEWRAEPMVHTSALAPIIKSRRSNWSCVIPTAKDAERTK